MGRGRGCCGKWRGARYADTDAPPDVIREMKENREDFLVRLRARLEAGLVG
jgi:hypothetical protein